MNNLIIICTILQKKIILFLLVYLWLATTDGHWSHSQLPKGGQFTCEMNKIRILLFFCSFNILPSCGMRRVSQGVARDKWDVASNFIFFPCLFDHYELMEGVNNVFSLLSRKHWHATQAEENRRMGSGSDNCVQYSLIQSCFFFRLLFLVFGVVYVSACTCEG